MPGGHAYLCAVLDWHSRYVLSWELSNTLDARFCTRAMQRAIAAHGAPEIVNTDQGCQFTSRSLPSHCGPRASSCQWTAGPLPRQRLRRTLVAHGQIRGGLSVSYGSLVDAHAQLETYFRFYNERRPHRAYDGGPPGEASRATEPEAVNQ